MKVQVEPSHYEFLRYVRKDRFLNYWYQIQAVLQLEPKTVLEVGSGDQTVALMLKKSGVVVTTVDLDEQLKPDVVASVDDLPLSNGQFDVVLCSEVLEHLPFEKFKIALSELGRVSKGSVVLGLPHAGGVVDGSFKIPLVPRFTFFFKIPFFWKKHVFNGEHYWELGKKGYSVEKIQKEIESCGFLITETRINADDPAHYLFILKKK